MNNLQDAMNFPNYFEKMVKSFSQLSTYCPQLNTYEKLFKESTRLQTSLSNFYALIVIFCTKTLEVKLEKGTIH